MPASTHGQRRQRHRVRLRSLASQPVFTVPSVINAGQSLVLEFNALVSASITAGNYCNSYRVSEGGINQVTGALACVDVGGGTIGDTLFRDWDGDGLKDPEDEGLPGVTMKLYAGACPPSGGALQTQTTDANGFYQFTGLTAGTYCADVDSGVPAGYTLTKDPEGAANGEAQVTLATGEKRLDIDFGYKPGGNGSIGDTVFDDKGNDGDLQRRGRGHPQRHRQSVRGHQRQRRHRRGRRLDRHDQHRRQRRSTASPAWPRG